MEKSSNLIILVMPHKKIKIWVISLERNSKKEFLINVFYCITVFLIVIAVYYVLIKFLFPFVIGAVIAFAVQPLANRISQKIRLSQGVWSVIFALMLYALVGTILCFLAYRIIVLAIDFTEYLPSFFEKARTVFINIGDRYANVFKHFPEELRLSTENFWVETIEKFVLSLGNIITKGVSGFIKKMPLFFISGIVTLVASCYISKDFLQLKRFVKELIGEKIAQKGVKIKNILIGSVFKILKGYVLLYLITTIELYLGFLILGIKRAFLFSVIIAVVDLLPVLGTGTILVPWAILSILSDNLQLGIAIAVLYIIIVLVRNFLEPKIIGMQVGVNSLFTLMAMFLGLKVLGFWGLILFPVILIVTIQYYKSEMKEGLSV